MGTSGGEPRILLNALKPMLSMNGDIKTPQEVIRIVGLMKDAEKLMSRCIYLNILRATCLAAKSDENKKETLQKFLVSGGWGVLNKWLMEFSNNENFAILLELIEVLKNMPITVELLKQGNTGKLIRQMTKLENAELKKSAMLLIRQWKDMIRGGSGEAEKSVKHATVNGEHPDVDHDRKSADADGMDQNASPSGKRMRENAAAGDHKGQPPEKKAKNVAGKAQLKVKMIDPTPKAAAVESSGFMNALAVAATAPVVKKKKKATTPTTKPNLPLDEIFSRQGLDKSNEKENIVKKSPVPGSSPMQDTTSEADQKGKNQKTEEKETEAATKDGTTDSGLLLGKTGKKKKSVRWAADEAICQTFFFEIDEEERASMHHRVNFSDAKQMELLSERKALATAKRLSEDRMVERLQWRRPPLLDCTPYPISMGEKSTEKVVQSKREQNVLADIFLTKASLPDSPAEPDAEPEDHSKKEPTVIPHDEAGTLYPVITPHPPVPSSTNIPQAISIGKFEKPPFGKEQRGLQGEDNGFGPSVFKNQMKGFEQGDLVNNLDASKFPLPVGLNPGGMPRLGNPNSGSGLLPVPGQMPHSQADMTSTVQNILTHLRGAGLPGAQKEGAGLLQNQDVSGNGQGLLGAAPSVKEEQFGAPPVQSLLGLPMAMEQGAMRGGPAGNRGRGLWGPPRGAPRGRGRGQFNPEPSEEYEPEGYEEEYDEPPMDFAFQGGRGRDNFRFQRGGRRGRGDRGHGVERGRMDRGRGRGFGGDRPFEWDRGRGGMRGRGDRVRGGDRGRGFGERGWGRGERGRGRGRDTKDIVCRHFMQRGCRNGTNCMFLHPGVS